LRSTTTTASSPAGGAAATAATGCKAAASPAAPRKAAGEVVASAAFAAPSTSNQNAVKQFVAAFSHVGSTAASVALGVEFVAAIAAAVKTAAGSGSVAADVHYQFLSRCNRDNGADAPAIGFGGTRPVSPESNDRDVRHARWYLESLFRAGVVKRLVIRKRGVRGTARHDAVTGLAAASWEHCRGNATRKRIAAKS
jgi:hypothetical protein